MRGITLLAAGVGFVIRLTGRSTAFDVLGVTGGCSGIAAEHLIKRLVQGVGEPDLIAEGHKHLLQEREARGTGGFHVHRLDVH